MLPQASSGKEECILTTDWMDAICGEKREGNDFTTGWFPFTRITENNYTLFESTTFTLT